MDPLATDPFAAALLLAGTASRDPELGCAALDPTLRGRVAAAARASAALRERGREAAMAALVAASTPRVPTGVDDAPPRVRAVVATLVDRARGTAWLRAAAHPRTGFRPSSGLRSTIACTEEDAWRA